MKDISGKELCKILKQNGWELKTIKGSHHVYMKEGIHLYHCGGLQRLKQSLPVSRILYLVFCFLYFSY